MLYKLIGYTLRFVFATLYRWRVRGVEALPAAGGCIIVANHCNFFDPPILGAAVIRRRTLHFMAKAEIFTWPVLGLIIPRVNAFPVRRGAFDRQAINAALSLTRAGRALCLFPEGTRHRDGRVHDLRGGAAMIHLATGVPVIPVGIAGADRLRPFRFPRLGVMIGRPLTLPATAGLPEREAIAAVNGAIKAGIEAQLAMARELVK